MPLPDSYKFLHTTELLTEPPLTAKTYQTPHRYTGRRIQVFVGACDVPVFDTLDHYDIGNACNAVDLWATEQINAGAFKRAADLEEHRRHRAAVEGRK